MSAEIISLAARRPALAPVASAMPERSPAIVVLVALLHALDHRAVAAGEASVSPSVLALVEAAAGLQIVNGAEAPGQHVTEAINLLKAVVAAGVPVGRKKRRKGRGRSSG